MYAFKEIHIQEAIYTPVFYVNFRFRQNREPDQHGSLLKSVFGQALILDDSDFLSVAQKLQFSSKIQVLEL